MLTHEWQWNLQTFILQLEGHCFTHLFKNACFKESKSLFIITVKKLYSKTVSKIYCVPFLAHFVMITWRNLFFILLLKQHQILFVRLQVTTTSRTTWGRGQRGLLNGGHHCHSKIVTGWTPWQRRRLQWRVYTADFGLPLNSANGNTATWRGMWEMEGIGYGYG